MPKSIPMISFPARAAAEALVKFFLLIDGKEERKEWNRTCERSLFMTVRRGTRSGSCKPFFDLRLIREHIGDEDLALATEKESKAQGWTFAASET